MTPGTRAVRLGLLAVALLTAVLAVLDARRDGVTADEPIHLAAGVAQATHGSWAVNVELPPFAKEAWGRAARQARAVETPPLSFRSLFLSARAQLFGAADPVKVLLAARLVTVAFLVLLLVFTARAAGGGEAGLLAAALLAGQTALVPHGHLVTADVPAAALIAAAVWGTISLYDRPFTARVLGTALAAAAAIATKQTALVLLPLLPLLLVPALRLSRDRVVTRRFVLVAVALPLLSLALLAVLLRPWTAGEAAQLPTLLSLYRLPEGDASFVTRVAGVDEGLGRYALSTLFVLRQTEAGRLSYLLGEVSTSPSPAYHLVALLVKSPLPWLLLVAAGILAAFIRAPLRARLLLFSGAVFLAASLGGPRIGVRHLIPVVVLLSAGAAAALGPSLLRRSPAAFALALLLALSPLAFGRSVGRHGLAARFFSVPPLADSNLDWGQDLPRLADLAARRDIPPASLGVAYFGGDLPSFRIPGCIDLLAADAPLPRYVAVSRQLLLVGPETVPFAEGRPRAARVLAELKARDAQFVARAGDSIDVFEVPARR
ncbi:MAG: glycosyltransferase family 39 protein [Thermoanaerobaculia bacterium]|nr:glycosyltransferase family 39 protein [Thermoanaerobaculia bacterium]